MRNWRSEAATPKQIAYIQEMQEFSDFPLPNFIGKTKGEASDYIDKWHKLAHERADFEGHTDNYGDR